MQVTLKQSDIHTLTQSHPHTHMYIHTYTHSYANFGYSFLFCGFVNAFEMNWKLWLCIPIVESPRALRRIAPKTTRKYTPPPRCSSRGQIFCLAKVKATIVFSVFVLFSPFAVPSEKLSTFCSRLAARLVPLFNFIVRLAVCLFVCHFCLLWCPWSVMIIIDNDAVEGRKGGAGRARSVAR